MYAVVAPGLKGIYEDPKVVDRILALYPYTKFRKFRTEEECWAFLARHENNHELTSMHNFGDTFDRHRVIMEYIIKSPNLYFNYDTHMLGTLRLTSERAVIENRTNLVKAMIPNVIVDAAMIGGHIIAIYNGIKLLGNFIDVEVVVPDYSIFYAMRSYSGNDRVIRRLRDYIDTRLGKVSVTMGER